MESPCSCLHRLYCEGYKAAALGLQIVDNPYAPIGLIENESFDEYADSWEEGFLSYSGTYMDKFWSLFYKVFG